ncbi:MAG: hypothetical protein K2J65_07840 [Duncaniella sp.]|nr:hypothetical protein [Duncaniella sp.]
MSKTASIPSQNRIASFIWQHILLLISLYIMTLGVALCVRSNLGSSVISGIPMAFSIAGAGGLAPALTIGEYTNIMNIVLVMGQLLVLRRRFEKVQLFQLVIGFVFGTLIDLNMYLTSAIACDTLPVQAITQFAGCTIMAFGIAMEVRCGSVTMPGEGFPVAISRVTGKPFPKIKIIVDVTLVSIAVASCYYFWGAWQWNIIGIGTLFAMVYVGYVVKLLNKHMDWFDRLLCNHPGFRRYIYGLAKWLMHHRESEM